MRPLSNDPMADGSRRFGDLPQTRSWPDVRDHVATLDGARLTGFLCDGVSEAWIDFTYAGVAFTINDQLGEYQFFVDDPGCPDDVLLAVLDHFTALLGDRFAAEARRPEPLAYHTPEKPAGRTVPITLAQLLFIMGILAVLAGIVIPASTPTDHGGFRHKLLRATTYPASQVAR